MVPGAALLMLGMAKVILIIDPDIDESALS
jgi:hypothetical protein